MIVTFGEKKLYQLVYKQLNNNFFLEKDEEAALDLAIAQALIKTEKCFQANINKYYLGQDNQAVFNPYHSGQYCVFLYFLSQQDSKNGHRSLADRTYYLNKMLNGCDLLYAIELPEVFFLEHPVGSVMGRASYGNYFVFQQNCTVGGNKGVYPQLGEFVWMFANATIIGDTKIGNNVFISVNALVKDENIPDNTIVFGSSPNLVLKPKPPEYFYGLSPFKLHRDMIA